ncbi:fasciclin domain-containing protein [Microbacterium sp. NPDC076895]|uniref:fasciclin domain-containing protein n=1 Tax=Microbacterium sp. NPDC076895 TaxID=3154957 RepID=UPI003415CA2C
MLITKKSRVAAGASLAFVAALALSACSTASTGDMDDEMAETPMTEQTTPMDDMEEMDATAYLVGAGCAEYAEAVPSGAGSVDGMAMDPVATAASNNPLLTTLTAAVSGGLNPDVNLVDTLNGGEFTVFAPVDDAFAKIDQATIDTLSTDSDLLTSILTYHVVPGQILPEDLPGTHTTVQGADVEVTGSGDNLMVNDAMVICGGVQTANAVVYLVDTVLMPPM